MSDPIYVGSDVRLRCLFYDKTVSPPVLANPTTVTLTIVNPIGSPTTVTGGSVTNDSTGVYHADFVPSMKGAHKWRWEGSGAAVAVAQGQFTVLPNNTG